MTEQVVPPPLVQRSNRTPLWIGTAVLLVLAIGGYLSWQSDEPADPSAPAKPTATAQSDQSAAPTPSD
ncbi:MAG: hypothetical protein WBB60_13265, partial [Nitrospira sp.]